MTDKAKRLSQLIVAEMRKLGYEMCPEDAEDGCKLNFSAEAMNDLRTIKAVMHAAIAFLHEDERDEK